ncbi:MAG: acetate--CoA ligase [Rhodospirillaceae bacterium]|nr:acetate--CoA ligase [Rhodospirillaceae bacterium]HAA93149.1 acetate--CoA ligase [Rhodospirillaceae bacterium]
MARLTDYTSYADAQAHFTREGLWDMFDGDRAHFNITHECIDRFASRQEPALRIAHADGRDEFISFAELSRLSAQVAHYLKGEGVKKGDRVAVMIEPSRPFYAMLFGIVKAGAVAVPLFTLFGPEGIKLRVDDCRPTLVFTSADKIGEARLAGVAEPVLCDEGFITSLASLPERFDWLTAGDDLALLQYTSGTTRLLPEAVRHTHRSLVTLMVAALYATGIRPGDRFFCPSSPAWGHGMWHGTLAPLAMGVSSGTFSGKFDPERLLKALSDYRITNLSAAATHYRMMRICGQAGRFAFALEKLSFTGEPIDSETAEFVKATFSTPACSMYGTTEVGVILANYPGAADLEVRKGSLGKPVPGIGVGVLRQDGTQASPDEIGELMVMRRDGWFPTKDLARIDADGFFYHHGRADDVIISAGWTMSAVEIENAILRHPNVAEAAAIGAPDSTRGQVVKAFVVLKDSSRAGQEEEIQDIVRQNLARHEYPRIIEFVDALPKTPAGKINRKELRDQQNTGVPAPN